MLMHFKINMKLNISKDNLFTAVYKYDNECWVSPYFDWLFSLTFFNGNKHLLIYYMLLFCYGVYNGEQENYHHAFKVFAG
jgi:hypothetical protein